jgi:hypothetical protein
LLIRGKRVVTAADTPTANLPYELESVVITPFGAAFGKAIGLDGADQR